MNPLITHLRPAKHEDCHTIYELHRLSVRHTCIKSYNQEILDAWLSQLNPNGYAAALDNPHKTMWVIEYTASAAFSCWTPKKPCWTRSMSIPSYKTTD